MELEVARFLFYVYTYLYRFVFVSNSYRID
jgi:hypothetical protein